MMKNKITIFCLLALLFVFEDIKCSDLRAQSRSDQTLITFDSKEFATLFATSKDASIVIQDPRWKKFVVYNRLYASSRVQHSSITMTQGELNKRYENIQNSYWLLKEEGRCALMIDSIALLSRSHDEGNDAWEAPLDGLEQGFTRYIPNSFLSWFASWAK